MNTLYLDVATWDLAVDSENNIAVASDAYAIAQDVSSSVRVFSGELWYDDNQGMPYFGQILGKKPNLGQYKQSIIKEALRVPEATEAQTFITSITDREVSGQIHTKDSAGNTTVINL